MTPKTRELPIRQARVEPPVKAPLRTIVGWCRNILFVVGVSALAYCAVLSGMAALFQHHAREQFLHSWTEVATSTSEWPLPHSLQVRGDLAIVGRIDIPRVNLSAMVAEGASARVLGVAVGHIPGTALPYQVGNVVLVAHRDSFFHRLGELKPGDVISLAVPGNRYRYRVTFTDIVEPQETWVLGPSTGETLTLVTCYPFHFVGPAPRRFVVRARQEDRPQKIK